jgi:hypothetical protein
MELTSHSAMSARLGQVSRWLSEQHRAVDAFMAIMAGLEAALESGKESAVERVIHLRTL